jgi:hypothetical protein
MKYDYERMHQRWQNSPRLTSLYSHFESIAKGEIQVPSKAVTVDKDWLKQNPKVEKFSHLMEKNLGTFYQHFCASIPYILEEQCRLGQAITSYASYRQTSRDNPLSYYESSAADAPLGRTLAEISQGAIQTLADSPNPTNINNFHKACYHNWSHIHLGPFFDITPDFLCQQNLAFFTEGFDIVNNCMTFQFYDTMRDEQLAYVVRLLKEDGIYLISEKFKHINTEEFLRCEWIKDTLFKSQYFSNEKLEWKQAQMLKTMTPQLVTMHQLVNSLKKQFNWVYLIWNSGNFYELVCSNHEQNLKQFICYLITPHIPKNFLCEPELNVKLENWPMG